MDLSQVRVRIDEIDRELMRLFCELSSVCQSTRFLMLSFSAISQASFTVL